MVTITIQVHLRLTFILGIIVWSGKGMPCKGSVTCKFMDYQMICIDSQVGKDPKNGKINSI